MIHLWGAENGFNPLETLSKYTGESMGSLEKRMEAGAVSIAEVVKAFEFATSAGDRYYKMNERQAQTITGKWNEMKEGINDALRQIGESLFTNLDLSGWLTWINDWLAKIPAFFRNAGSLLKAEILNWNIYLLELVPGAESVVLKIGAIFAAGWDAMGASYHKFIDSIKAGFVEIGNLAKASLEGLKGAGSGWWETAKTYFSGGILGEAGAENPFHMFQKGGAAFNKEFAGQQDAMKPGEDFASTFARQFKTSLANAAAGAAGMPSLTDSLKKQRDNLLAGVAAKEKALKDKPAVSLGGKLGASFEAAAAKDKTDADKNKPTEMKAALKGSSEAASIMTRGIAAKDDKALKVAEKHLEIAKQTLAKLAVQGKETAQWAIANF